MIGEPLVHGINGLFTVDDFANFMDSVGMIFEIEKTIDESNNKSIETYSPIMKMQ